MIFEEKMREACGRQKILIFLLIGHVWDFWHHYEDFRRNQHQLATFEFLGFTLIKIEGPNWQDVNLIVNRAE